MMKLLLIAACLTLASAQWVNEMENPGLWEGDIVLDPDEIEPHMKGKIGTNQYASIKGGRWPTTIHYQFESGFASGGRAAVAAAIKQYEEKTCLRFVQGKSSSGSYLSFYPGGGCSSPVGYRRGRVNRISLARGCWRVGTVMHEIGHSIGLYHEQSRPDRDQFVEILWKNIKGGMDFNFNKQKASNIDSLGTPYDYNSMMHYGAYGFGGGSMTIRTKDPSKQRVIGQRLGPSPIDVTQLNRMYCNSVVPTGGPRPETSAPKTNAPSGNCVDKHSNCHVFTKYCNVASWRTHMTKYCSRTCRIGC